MAWDGAMGDRKGRPYIAGSNRSGCTAWDQTWTASQSRRSPMVLERALVMATPRLAGSPGLRCPCFLFGVQRLADEEGS